MKDGHDAPDGAATVLVEQQQVVRPNRVTVSMVNTTVKRAQQPGRADTRQRPVLTGRSC